MPDASRGFGSRFIHFLLVGPEDPDPATAPRWVQTLLPWPMRAVAVAVAFVVGWNWSGTPLGDELAGGLQYAGLIVISLALSYWWAIFVLNVGLALAWLVCPLGSVDESPVLWFVHHTLSFVNRQVGHIEALSVWLALALVGPGSLAWQLAAIAACLLVGEPVIDGVATWWMKRRPQRGVGRAALYWNRRPLFYVATLLGMVLVALLAPRQWFKLVPAALALAGADAIRTWRHVRWNRRIESTPLDQISQIELVQHRWGSRIDLLLGPGLVLAVLAVLVGANAWAHRRYEAALLANLPTRGGPIDYCTAAQPPAPAADVAVFIVSDSQFHELGGRPFAGQMPFADALVPVAVRPVELDLLSAAPLGHFATVFRKLAAERPADSPMWWAHLGDLGDVACQREMDRATGLLGERYDVGRFAGVAPGNHDKAFMGNFFWSPYWDSACPSGRMEKIVSDEKLRVAWADRVHASHGRMAAVSGWDFMAAATRRGGALVTATPLGAVRDGGERRGVIGVFLDTSDGHDFDLGVAGLFGTFSSQQAAALDRILGELRGGLGAIYHDPFYVVFMHHPLGEMARRSDQRLRQWIASLDGDASGHEPRARVLGLVSAHTHEAQKHSHCIGGRELPEVVVGSTLDLPQEAALLSLGPTNDGRVALRVQTLPSVARPHQVCGARVPAVTALECQTVMAGLRERSECARLFRMAEANALGRDCSDVEHAVDWDQRLVLATRWLGPRNENEIRADQQRRADALWSCVCRGQAGCALDGGRQLDDDKHFDLLSRELVRSPERERELVCLAWAAAAIQRYKGSGMTLADALRCGFDDRSVPSAHDYIAPLEVIPCYQD